MLLKCVALMDAILSKLTICCQCQVGYSQEALQNAKEDGTFSTHCRYQAVTLEQQG